VTTVSVRSRVPPVRRLARELVYGPEFERVMRLCEQTQWMAPERLEDLQWQQAQVLLREVYARSPYYRSRLVAAGWPPGGREWLTRLPVLKKVEVIARAPDVQAAGSARSGTRTSGGTTGTPVPITVDRATYPWYVAGTYRGLRWWGADFFDRGVILLGRSHQSALWALAARVKDWATGWLRVPVDREFDARIVEMAAAAVRHRPSFVYGYPSAVYRLARSVAAAGVRHSSGPRVVVVTGEPLFDFQRQAIQRAFDCPVVEEYGCGELGSVAFQCPSGRLHVTAESVLLEAPPVAEGRPGPVIATHLRNVHFPLLRYDTGDLGNLAGSGCPCGRGLPLFQLAGRSRDVLPLPEGQVPVLPYLRQFLARLPERAASGVQVRYVVPGGWPTDPLPAPGAGTLVVAAEREALEEISASALRGLAQEVFGPGWHVAVAAVDRIPRSPAGKIQYFTTWRVSW
jgi:phenylacetate-CoA ligase